MKKLSNAQIDFLHFAYLAPTRGWDGVAPRRGQHAMVWKLVRRGLLWHIGTGSDANCETLDGRNVELFAITGKGGRAIRATLRGGAHGDLK